MTVPGPGFAPSAAPAGAAEKLDRRAVAERLVAECAGVREGDLVLVAGDVRDVELLEELRLATVSFEVGVNEEQDLYRDVPAARLAAVSKAFQPVSNTLLARSVRQVQIGNGLYPTAAPGAASGRGLPRWEEAPGAETDAAFS